MDRRKIYKSSKQKNSSDLKSSAYIERSGAASKFFMIDQESIELSIIIPIRCTMGREYIIDRLEYFGLSISFDKRIEVIVVDSGSDPVYRTKIKRICKRYNFKCFYVKSENQVFSPGQARDYGASVSCGKYLVFQDIDLFPSPTFYDDIMMECQVNRMNVVENDFFVIPCLYITENGTKEFLLDDPNVRHKFIYHKYIFGDKENCHFMAPFSSCIVVKRNYFLSTGGHDPSFSGHGYEDFDLGYRLSMRRNKFNPPIDRHTDYGKYDLTKYSGLRAMLAVHGLATLAKGLFIVHLWHPRPNTQGFENWHPANRARLKRNMKKFDSHGEFLPPLGDNLVKGRMLVLAEEGHWTLEPVRQSLPLMGKPIYRPAEDFTDEIEFGDFLIKEQIDAVFSNNPYGNEHRLKLYKYCRINNIPYLTFDRGGLPDSWFFDWNGFNADSSSYKPEVWNNPLNKTEKRRVKEYISATILSDKTLEKNGPRTSGYALRQRYKVGGKKILFVPFQRPNDTATVHFSGKIGGTEQFSRLVDEVAKALPKKDWVILAKTHPLETESAGPKNVKFVEPDTHIYDLLEAADAILTMNSGVGLLAAMFNKLCICCSEAYYGHEGIAWKANDSKSVIEIINNFPKTNEDIMLRFIYYLRFSFYSFGTALTVTRKQLDGSLKTITKQIRFYELRGVNGREYNLQWNSDVSPLSAPIFTSFAYWDAERRAAIGRHAPDKMGEKHGTQLLLASNAGGGASVFRKTRKLLRSPKVFWRDSIFWRWLRTDDRKSREKG